MRDWGFGIGKAKANATARLRACANPDPDSGGSWPDHHDVGGLGELHPQPGARDLVDAVGLGPGGLLELQARSEEHTSELQSLMRISYAVFCLKKKNSETKNLLQNNNIL